MKNYSIIFLILIIFSSTLVTAQSQQQFAEIGTLELVSGELITNCNIGYRTFGKLNADSSNVIIYPTWFEGTTENVGRLIEKYIFIDTSKYFIIAMDALGNGISTSPSNYNVYKIKTCPEISIRDMVNSQYKMLTEVFKLKHIFAAVGGSLGAMQVLEWSVAYPNFISKIVAYVGTPKMSTYDLLWINAQLNIIQTGKHYGVTEKEIRKSLAMMMAGIGRTPDYIVEKVKPEDFQNYLKDFDNEYSSTFTLEDYENQLKAIMHHDIAKGFNGSMEDAANSINAKLFLIISETDLLVNPIETKRFAKLTNAKTMILNNNCGHLAVSCEIERCREEIALFLED
jgi:homoserine O-acetyltransferase/O-succinyltransferase